MGVQRPFSSGSLSVIGVSQKGRPLLGEDVVPVVSDLYEVLGPTE